MSQPTRDTALVSHTSCWSSNTTTETEISGRLYRNAGRPDGVKCVSGPLRPAPLFRSIGPTGSSASLPPHRRLRSILRRARAVRPDNQTSKTRGGENASTDASNRPLPFKDFLPDIATPKLSTNQETRTRERHAIGRSETFRVRSPDNNAHATGPFQTYTSRRTVVFPLAQRHRETPESANRKRWSTKIRQILASEKASDQRDISERFHSLVLTDQRPSADDTQEPRVSPGSEPESQCRAKGAWPCRRDRRPHFLPPISHSGCLLDVPFALPENSPPPSPSSVLSAPFFPLSVPVRPQRRRRRADADPKHPFYS